MLELPPKPADLYEIESLFRGAGHRVIAGVDEAGRGPLAGPVVAAAVILPAAVAFPGLNDSKKLTARQRETLFAAITRHPDVEYAAITITAARIDKINILQATHEGMRKAVQALRQAPDLALIDGKPVSPFPVPARNLVRGDSRVAAIAAAGIIAKVIRDDIMRELDQRFPAYGFAAHKGYGTAQHVTALAKYGPCPEHRRSFRPVAEAVARLPQQADLPLTPPDDQLT